MRHKSRISVISAVLTAFLILFTPFFIALHADHECTGEDCPVCAVTVSFERIMGGSQPVKTAAAVAFFAVVCALLYTSVTGAVTPVILKVRLLN